jgi:AcrR family transcriptional regulator
MHAETPAEPPGGQLAQNRLPKSPISGRYPRGVRTSIRREEILRAADATIARMGLKASLHDIAHHAGILPGSLYFHFESREELLAELVQRYHADLDRIAERTLQRLDEPHPAPPATQLSDLASAIARTAVKHRAALQLTFYETPDSPGISQPTSLIQQAMTQVVRAGRWSGYLRPDLDVVVLAEFLRHTMLRIGLDFIRQNTSSDDAAATLLGIAMQGLATTIPPDDELDRSAAFTAARSIVDRWQEDSAAADDNFARIQAAARSEFSRRGYDTTTIRDIAATANVSESTVYRVIGSKKELLTSIMRAFGEKVGLGWSRILRIESSPIEKLDAMSWLSINAVHQFPDEFRIQLAWLSQSAPDTATPGWSFSARITEVMSMLVKGITHGDLTVGQPLSEAVARGVIMLQWMPEDIIWHIGTSQSLSHLRGTILRGAASRKPPNT